MVRLRQDLINLQPEAVVILAGTNDITEITGVISVEAVFGNIVSMVETAKTSEIKVILSSLLPVYDYWCCPAMEPVEKIKKLNKLTKECTEKNELLYIDYYSIMFDDKGDIKSSLSED